ncbi:hypothetical protein AB1Y20_016861 [Prymnesium parvum]|uniref:non-specific serine/threonine protein kinase n=1 Tax=Prymnesium parvum TaxID=97485 RepID=A0AB34I977_PRYPA|mmetsp:Transcript_5103/g.13038  ORF Transcript_5103/g.13038 Transcript_5103/m.13038 type:complete len:619 (+) Transcript_5103:161-2017(+)
MSEQRSLVGDDRSRREDGKGRLNEGSGPAAASEQRNKEDAAVMLARKLAEDEEYRKRVEEQMQAAELNGEDAERELIEERRRRRAEIAARHQAKPPTMSTEEAPQHKVDSENPTVNAVPTADQSGSAGVSAAGGAPAELAVEPSATNTAAGDTDVEMRGVDDEASANVGLADADSDDDDNPVPLQMVPSADLSEHDRKMESQLRAYLLEHRRKQEGLRQSVAAPSKGRTDAVGTDGDEGKEDLGGFDIFNDDVEEAAAVEEAVDEAAMMDRGDNYDDKEGYYAHRVGDVLNDRYKVLGSFGKGVFSTVVRCVDLRSPHGLEVAIKVQRNNEMMRRAGEKEIMYLQELTKNDPENRRHCIQLLGTFDHEDHLCMVFEALHQNLRMALRQHGHKRGIQMDAVRMYARQLFTALRYMERLNIMHADLKPDNIVVNDKYNLIKVCDFGSASGGDDNEITPYLVSRFYRAPEIMMGLNYGCPIDMWAAGVSLFELYTGKIMFQGTSNNHMLKLIQEIKGKMPHKLIRKGVFSELHFDPDYDFLFKERDKVTQREIVRIIKFEQRPVPGKDIRSQLMPNKMPESETRKVLMLADLLEKTLMLDPAKRLRPSEALKHPFCDLSRK